MPLHLRASECLADGADSSQSKNGAQSARPSVRSIAEKCPHEGEKANLFPPTPLSRPISNGPITSEGGFILVQKLDERPGFGGLGDQHLIDLRRRKKQTLRFGLEHPL